MNAQRPPWPRPRQLTRRDWLRIAGGVGLAGPVATLLGERRADAALQAPKRVIFFYYPDGVPAESQAGEPSAWHPKGSTQSFTLPPLLAPLQPWTSKCVFFRNLSLGSVDSGSHPGGAKKLLTGVDGGGGQSVDQFLAQTIGKAAPFHHLYLGVQATANNASGDKFISYWAPGQTATPIDDPTQAFALLFGKQAAGAGGPGGAPKADPLDIAVVDNALLEVKALQQQLGPIDKQRLDAHLAALEEVETRLKKPPIVNPSGGACAKPTLDTSAFGQNQLNDPSKFPAILNAQMDLAVLALSCDLTRVVTLQCSSHTSELIMSRFAGTKMYQPNFDMRSHQASHYGAKHDLAKAEYQHFVWQRAWFLEQYAALLQRLAAVPEGEGTMLDHTLVLLCTEVCDGNTHLHDDMPLVLAGGNAAIPGGRLLDLGWRRHGDLLAGICHALGQKVAGYGQQSSGPLPGLLAGS